MIKFFLATVWAVCALLAVCAIAQPISVETQLATAGTAIVIALVISVFRLGGIFRHILLAITTGVILRYLYWRTTETLPSPDDLLSFVPAIALYAAEIYCILMLAMSLFVVADPRQRKPAPQLADDKLPEVDVFVPSYNESADILSLTLSAAKSMDYPADKLRVFLLDDGSTDQKRNAGDPVAATAARRRHAELQALCAELGVDYLTRPLNVHAKAGNLNHGLANSRGELVVVFDADHAPAREFLRETVGYFGADRRLFLVQTPHVFGNPDPLERNLSTFDRMPSENEMFYGQIQKGLDKWNAAFFCGSAAVLRRAALEQVGGFAGITITEDAETALELHAKGWNSIYVDKPLISGLQPETFASFIGQRSRWCQGMVQILLLKTPFLKSGLTLAQRICYSTSSMFWFFPFMRIAFIISPLLFIFFNLKIYVASVEEFFAYTISYLVAGEILRSYLYGRVRWPWVSELYEYVQSIFLSRAIVQTILSPRRPTFNVTAKGETLEDDRLSALATPFFVIFALLAAGFAFTVYRYMTEPEIGGLLLVVGGWNLFNLIIAAAGIGVVVERRERRNAPRLPCARTADLVVDGQRFAVSVEDVSMGGARAYPLMGMPKMHPNSSASLVLRGERKAMTIPTTVRTILSSDSRVELGLVFNASPADYPAIADLMLGDMQPIRSRLTGRQRHRGTIAGSLSFLGWALRYPFRGLYHLLFNRNPQPRPAQAAQAASFQPAE